MYARNRMKRCLFISFVVSLFIYIGFQIHQYRMTTVAGWDINISRDVRYYIMPNSSTMLMRPESLCEMPIFLLVFVCSAPPNFEERNAIRESWAMDRNISNTLVRVYFLMGQTFDMSLQEEIERENEIYKDVIQEGFVDTYNNLTLKSLMLLKLVKNDCKNTVRYVMKTDDDMFVNLGSLIKFLREQKHTTRLMLGNLICRAEPIRNYYDKWYAPEYMYSGKTYPNYLSGTGYVMSVDVPEIIFETALTTPLLHLEDVYLTGICAKRAKIRPKHNADFHFKKIKFDPCIYQSLITAHYVKPMEMRQTYFRVQNTDLIQACKVQMDKRRNVTATNLRKYKKYLRKTRNFCL